MRIKLKNRRKNKFKTFKCFTCGIKYKYRFFDMGCLHCAYSEAYKATSINWEQTIIDKSFSDARR